MGRALQSRGLRVIALARTLAGCGFLAESDPNIMRKKYAKLVLNLGNAMVAAAT